MTRFARSFAAAVRGIVHVYQHERNIRIHAAIAILVIAAALFFRVSAGEWFALGVCIAFVFTLEMVNSVIERVLDVVKPRLDHTVFDIKDIMAGAVLVAALFSFLVGVFIFVPRLLGIR